MSQEIEYGKAFSTDQRLKIIELLQVEPLTINELAEKISLKPITVRHHIQILEKVGLIEGVYIAREGKGRPAKTYKVTQKPISIEFPKRRYHYLADMLLQTFIRALGEEKVTHITSEMGREIGKQIVADMTEQYSVRKWDLGLFKKYLVDGHLTEMGTQPEIVGADENHIRLRLHNCLFFEVSKKYPDVMCAAHERAMICIAESMGLEVDVKRMKCMGQGDPYCEYLMKKKISELVGSS